MKLFPNFFFPLVPANSVEWQKWCLEFAQAPKLFYGELDSQSGPEESLGFLANCSELCKLKGRGVH